MAIPSWAKHLAPASSKFGAQRIEVDGITFHSKREARRWQQLRILEKAKQITNLRRQVPYPIAIVNLETGELVTVSTYFADFVYDELAGHTVVEDSKGFRTDIYKLKKRLVEAQYGVRIYES